MPMHLPYFDASGRTYFILLCKQTHILNDWLYASYNRITTLSQMIAYENVGYLIKFQIITNCDTSLLNAINVFQETVAPRKWIFNFLH